jgi:hypothetical protein
LTKRAQFLSKFHKNCPYCERPFSKKKHTVESKIIKTWVDEWWNKK